MIWATVLLMAAQAVQPHNVNPCAAADAANADYPRGTTGLVGCGDGYSGIAPYDMGEALAKEPPMDVPAIKVFTIEESDERERTLGPDYRDDDLYTCVDIRRVLLTSEDGIKHCILFGERKEDKP